MKEVVWCVATPNGTVECGSYEDAYQFFIQNKNSWPPKYQTCKYPRLNEPLKEGE